MAYPGRAIIIGRTPDDRHDVVVYAVTGRSRSSQARRLVHEGGGTVRTEVTDRQPSQSGNERLLLYRCLRPFPGGLAVSNGAQTDLIWETIRHLMESAPLPPAEEILRQAFQRPHLPSGVDVTRYEPDAPTYTPRISGCLAGDAALAIVRRRPDGSPQWNYFTVPLKPGQGRLLATYSGENRDPLPAFAGDPREVGLIGRSPGETAEAVFQALSPEKGGPDLRVGVATLFRDIPTGRLEVAIINRSDGNMSQAEEAG
jgi:IMP cyclohydrolase